MKLDLKKEALGITKLLHTFNLIKIKRRTTRVAQEITKFSFDIHSDGIILSSVPSYVVAYVTNDCKNIVSN